MSDKTPQAGEWWESNFSRARIIGHRLDGVAITEARGGFIGSIKGLTGWRHLPDCTGFDWEPETFPQYWGTIDGSTKPVAYLRRTAKDTFYHVYADGCEHGPYVWIRQEEPHRKQITEEEAESRIEKPQPAESPDDWVVQDRAPRRFACDEFRWITKQGECSSWFSAHEGSVPASHGHVDQFGSRLEVRCRRKDLPPLPNKFATLANEIEQLRADMMRRCDELGVRLAELEEGGK